MSERQACRTVQLSRCVYRYQEKRSTDDPIAHVLRQLADKQPRWGCDKMTDYLRNEGHAWNHKRIRRVYRTLSLHLKRKPKKRLPARTAQPLAVPEQQNQTWSLDFMSDALYEGTRFRTFNVIDDFNREVLAVEIDTSITGHRLIRVFERLQASRGLPQVLRVDNGPEFLSVDFVAWWEVAGITNQYIQPGEPRGLDPGAGKPALRRPAGPRRSDPLPGLRGVRRRGRRGGAQDHAPLPGVAGPGGADDGRAALQCEIQRRFSRRAGRLMCFEFATATRIIFGQGLIKEAAPLAASFGRRALIVTGSTI